MQEDDFEISQYKRENYNVIIPPMTSNTLRDAKNAKRCDSALKIRYIRSSPILHVPRIICYNIRRKTETKRTEYI